MQQDDERAVGESKRSHQLTQRAYQSVIDQQVAQAEAAGQFANLPGQGRPIRLDDDAHVPEEDRLGYRMLKGAGFAPPWMEARCDIDEERRRIDGWLVHANNRWPHLDEAKREKTRAEFRAKLEGLRSMIVDYNLRLPAGVEQLRGVELMKELTRLGAE